MNRNDFMGRVYNLLSDDPDNIRANLIIDSADEYAADYADEYAASMAPEWIPVTKEMPEEKDTMFAKYWGTDRWNKYMFRKRSDLVEVTVELDDGTRVTEASRTRDGKWAAEDEHGFVHKKVVAWHPMSEPWKGE